MSWGQCTSQRGSPFANLTVSGFRNRCVTYLVFSSAETDSESMTATRARGRVSTAESNDSRIIYLTNVNSHIYLQHLTILLIVSYWKGYSPYFHVA